MQLNVGSDYINVDGAMVEKDALGVAEALAAYDPNLYVFCLDPDVAGINDAPFIVSELCEDGQYRRIFECWELNKSVVDRAMMADSTKLDVLTEMEKINARVKLGIKQRYEESMLENQEQAIAVLKSPKSSYTVPNSQGGISKIFYNKPAERIS